MNEVQSTRPMGRKQLGRQKLLLGWILIYIIMVGVGALMNVPGSDWVHHWEPRFEIDAYPPWVRILLFFLPSLPFLSGLTLTALIYVLKSRQANLWHYLAAFTSMPLFWTLWLGQIDAVPMLGLALLPWGIPLVLIKPQVAAWYVWVWWRYRMDKWKIFLGCIAFFLLTVLIWGWWPGHFTEPAAFRTVYDLSAWKIHWILGVIFLIGALLENDPDRAAALGALGAPYIQGASYLVLVPVMTRLKGWQLFFVWLTTWASAAAIVLGDSARTLALLFPLSLWAVLAGQSFLARRQNRAGSDLLHNTTGSEV